ncbi:MAG: acyltransferase [Ruminococcus sp.]|jgi:fucose 4-O-acetylase-like acetyltransferase|nr:acyltransferase [Ruminococcus sp.]
MESKMNNTLNEMHFRWKVAYISFICSILVIYVHAYNIDIYSITIGESIGGNITYKIEQYFSQVTELAVPFFFLISGMLFFRNFMWENTLIKLKRRLKTLFLPYIIWCSIYYLYFVILTNISFVKKYISMEKVEISIKCWFDWVFINEYYVLWFLKYLIIFIFFTPLIFLLFRIKIGRISIGFLLMIFGYVGVDSGILYLPSGMIWFFTGAWLGIECRTWIVKQMVNNRIRILAIFYIIFVLFTGGNKYCTPKIFLFISIWFVMDFWKGKELPWWMKITFFTYVAHDMILETFEKLYLYFFGIEWYLALIDYVLMPIIIFGVLVTIAYILKRFIPKVWYIISGGR